MTHKELIAALRSTPSRSKRELFDTAADMIERLTQDKTVVSNADRIRAMSDEEMAEFMEAFYFHAWTLGAIVLDDDRVFLDWLKQPIDHAEVASDVLMQPNGEEDAQWS